MQYFKPPKYMVLKKQHKNRISGQVLKLQNLELKMGSIGLKALENGRLTPKQLEAMRRSLARKLQKIGKILFHVFPETAITKKPKEIRMGKGKGAIKLWIAKVYAGKLLLEISNIPPDQAREILFSAAAKLPVKTTIIFCSQRKSL